MNAFARRNRRAAHPKPTSGDISRTLKTLVACSQSTPDVPSVALAGSWLATPTPMIEPVIVCVLDAGRPSHHVPRFQRMAAISSENTIANPAPELTLRMSSTGSRVMVKATVPADVSTPARLHNPDQTTAMLGSRE